MKLKNIGSKIINIGETIALPGETVEVGEAFVKNGAVDRLVEMGYLSIETEEAPTPAAEEPTAEPVQEPEQETAQKDKTKKATTAKE